MPPSRYSRHRFSSGVLDDDDGRLMLTDPEPFEYQDRIDNVLHTVVQGENLWTIAGRYYASIPRGCGLWWVIADFQKIPIHDPTIALSEGTVLVIPSVRTVLEEILNDNRRDTNAGD